MDFYFLISRAQGGGRRLYDILIERVFRSEEKRNDTRVGRADIDALEKEVKTAFFFSFLIQQGLFLTS